MASQRHDQGVKKRRARELAQAQQATPRNGRAEQRMQREAARFAAEWKDTDAHGTAAAGPLRRRLAAGPSSTR
jgi:hypothetical protein